MDKIVFFDIKTHWVVPFDELSDQMKSAITNHYGTNSYKSIAGLHPEFSHVVCVSLGYQTEDGNINVRTLCGFDEVNLLNELSSILNNIKDKGYILAGYNSNHFDSAYLIRRYILNRIKVPSILYNSMKWLKDGGNLDLINLWKYNYDNVSLEILKAAFGIEGYTYAIQELNPDDIDIEKLKLSCENDVISMIKISNIISEFK